MYYVCHGIRKGLEYLKIDFKIYQLKPPLIKIFFLHTFTHIHIYMTECMFFLVLIKYKIFIYDFSFRETKIY